RRLGPTRRGHEEHERPPRRRATPPRTNEGDRAPAAAAVRGRGRGQPPAAAARPPGGAAVGGGARDAAAGAPLREEQRHGRARPLLPQLGRHRQRAGSPRVALPRHVAAHRAGHRRRRGGALHHGGRHQGLRLRPRSPAREQELPLVRRARARAHLSGVRSPLREDAVRRDGPELARQGGPAEQRVRDRRQRQPGVPAQGRAGGLLPARQPRRRRPQPQLGRGVAAGRRAGRKGHEPWAQGLQRARDQGLQAAHAGVQADHIPDGPQRHQGDVHALGVRHGAPGQPQPAPDDADPEGPGQGPLRMPLRCRGRLGTPALAPASTGSTTSCRRRTLSRSRSTRAPTTLACSASAGRRRWPRGARSSTAQPLGSRALPGFLHDPPLELRAGEPEPPAPRQRDAPRTH
ncbi:unnamed protein product, partial [Prorocentrum cordatum]